MRNKANGCGRLTPFPPRTKPPRPVWTLVDTWSPNVAGHATDGSLIRHCDSHFFPIQPRLQPLDKPTQLLTHRRPRREHRDREKRIEQEDRIERDEERCYKAEGDHILNPRKEDTTTQGRSHRVTRSKF
ncbi:hypothetical protein NQZ68_013310 [Xyrichtys novacula]|uniref:Uncharacterized protein n=1 Tax=Xyrichtys novacula TaxID=13765 RepID=A0AAV1FNI9_XYRNO|nr:hypothetical protein NQZ68_013310 [Xyrichtys novacula]